MDVLTAIVKEDVRDALDKAGIYIWLLSRCVRDLKVNMERTSKFLIQKRMKLFLYCLDSQNDIVMTRGAGLNNRRRERREYPGVSAPRRMLQMAD